MRLKRLLRNSGGVSLVKDRSGLQCVVDNHILDDNLRKEGWEVPSIRTTGVHPQECQGMCAVHTWVHACSVSCGMQRLLHHSVCLLYDNCPRSQRVLCS